MKKWIKRYLPKAHHVKHHESLKVLGNLIHQPNLWHLNRNSVSRAVTIGLFVAFIPIPIQMLLAAILCIIFRANILIAAALTWITNPATAPAIIYGAYRLGAWILQTPYRKFHPEFSLNWFLNQLGHIGLPWAVGTLIMATFCAIAGYLLIQLLWRISIIFAWQQRKDKNHKRSDK